MRGKVPSMMNSEPVMEAARSSPRQRAAGRDRARRKALT